MKSLLRLIFRFLKMDSGMATTEYAIMVALVFLGCVSAVLSLGQGSSDAFSNASNKINTATASTAPPTPPSG